VRKKALADDVEVQHCQELAKCVAALAELVSAAEQNHQQLVDCAAVLSESALASDCHCWVAAERSVTLVETALAKEKRCFLTAETALMEYNAQTKASQDATAVEVAKHATMLAVMALAELKAAPKLRYNGPLPTHFPPPLNTAEVAKLDASILNKRHATRRPRGRKRWPTTPTTTSHMRHRLR
jgi:hypothetical protein